MLSILFQGQVHVFVTTFESHVQYPAMPLRKISGDGLLLIVSVAFRLNPNADTVLPSWDARSPSVIPASSSKNHKAVLAPGMKGTGKDQNQRGNGNPCSIPRSGIQNRCFYRGCRNATARAGATDLTMKGFLD